jgi:hypothetical protein
MLKGKALPSFETMRTTLPVRLGGLQGRSGQVQKILLPPGFNPQTVQSVSSRYTDYATLAHSQLPRLLSKVSILPDDGLFNPKHVAFL